MFWLSCLPSPPWRGPSICSAPSPPSTGGGDLVVLAAVLIGVGFVLSWVFAVALYLRPLRPLEFVPVDESDEVTNG